MIKMSNYIDNIFNIDSEELCVDFNLITADVPILFVCNDFNDHKYLSLYIDENKYYLISITNDMLRQMLLGKVKIKDCFIKAEKFYYIKTGETIEEDEVIPINVKDLPDTDLPDDDLFFTVTEEEINTYINELENC